MDNKINVRAIADLAKLDFSEEEIRILEEDMTAIIGFAQHMSDADISGIEEYENISTVKNIFRDDVIESNFTADELLVSAKTKEDGYVTVPKVIEG